MGTAMFNGRKLSEQREKAGLKTIDLANAIHVSRTYIERLEGGDYRNPDMEKIREIADVLHTHWIQFYDDVAQDVVEYSREMAAARRIHRLLQKLALPDPESLLESVARLSPENQVLILDLSKRFEKNLKD